MGLKVVSILTSQRPGILAAEGMARYNALLGSPFELFFWRSRTQAEVDLVVKAEDGLRAFEINLKKSIKIANKWFSF